METNSFKELDVTLLCKVSQVRSEGIPVSGIGENWEI